MKFKPLFIILLLQSMIAMGQRYYGLIDELEEALDNKDFYIEQRENLIEEIKDVLYKFKFSGQCRDEISVYFDLVYEYQSFIYDSAQVYIDQAKHLAYRLQDRSLIDQVRIREGFVLLSSGLFKEAIDTLNAVNPRNLNDSLKSTLFSTMARAYYDIADFVRDPKFMPTYIAMGNNYLDSALLYVKPNTNEFWAMESLHRMKKSDWSGARFAFEYWMNNFTLPRHYYAIATSSLAYIYLMTGFPDLAIEYFTRAAIADVKTATMETVALRNLSNLLYQKGDDKRAYQFIIEALNDASYYNARHRQLEVGQILPIIERERMHVIRKQRDRIMVFTAFISVLTVALIAALVIIWMSFRRLNAARLIIQEANEKLTEANKIKDEYITDFFNKNSAYIDKLESLQNWVRRKVATRQFEDLGRFHHKVNIDKERLALYERFDQIFLKLFPDFVEEINKLLKPDERIDQGEGEYLNTYLRIYALIRLGIDDNEQIAKFLNISVNTIYTYKTKIKGKANCPSDQFIQKVMDIKSI